MRKLETRRNRMTFNQAAWDNLYYTHATGNVCGFNVLFSEFIDRIAGNDEKYQAAVSILDAYFYGGQRSEVFESVCALRRLQPTSPKINAMLLAAAIETARWDTVISVIRRNLNEPLVRQALISILAVWWPTLSGQAPDVFRELLCNLIVKAESLSTAGDHLSVFAQALSGSCVPDTTLEDLMRPAYGARAIALIGHIHQERYDWTKAIAVWSEVVALEPEFPGIEQLIARAIRNTCSSFDDIVTVLHDYADRPRIQQAIRAARFHNFVLIKGHKAVYRMNPKVGSTAILSSIWMANGGGDTPNPNHVHDDTEILTRLDQQPIEKIDEVINSEDWIRFSFVRHPVRRFVSAFLNKCTRLHIALGPYAPFLRAIGMETGTPLFAPIETRDDYRIEDVVRFTEKHAPQDLDMHFAPQTSVLNTAEIDYGFIGRMETFDQGLIEVSDLIRVDLANRGESLHGTNSGRFTDESLSEGVRERIMSYFRSDMVKFNYS
jgi:hypothetical protein